jgi:hypothetical protein
VPAPFQPKLPEPVNVRLPAVVFSVPSAIRLPPTCSAPPELRVIALPLATWKEEPQETRLGPVTSGFAVNGALTVTVLATVNVLPGNVDMIRAPLLPPPFPIDRKFPTVSGAVIGPLGPSIRSVPVIARLPAQARATFSCPLAPRSSVVPVDTFTLFG